ncbi:tetratricopeptide repeat protein [Winogradskyella vidalii]|uniref:tetratricopeptide repeat protein n=1 Tax=Winogradskyella vidalii TaxID=2615024 RepID=UPI0015C92656|nr:hypothetical protein [Winogradskyella vidalii]
MKQKLQILQLKYGVFTGTVLFKIVLSAILFLCLSTPMFAHGDLSKKIKAKSLEILESPNNYELYFERGVLYQQHVEFGKAMDDYIKSKALGNKDKVLKYRISEVNYLLEEYNSAFVDITSYLEISPTDVKAKKLEAQILFQLKKYKKSLAAYKYVMDHMLDIRPEDILEYTDIILAENPKNYDVALNAIEIGLTKLGENTLSLQLKKLDYLKAANETEKALNQYDYFIIEYKRKEFWYYKKAAYLLQINKTDETNIALKQATIAIGQLDAKFKNMSSILKLKKQIKHLENLINNKNYD